MDQYAELAQRLKPHIIKWKLQASATSVAAPSTGSLSVAWSNINFAGSSIGDIANRTHSLLTGRENDDHTQYVLGTGRGGFATIDAILRVNALTDTRYRTIVSTYAAGTIINAYDDTALAYIPMAIDGSTIRLSPGGNTALGLTVTSTGAITAAPSTTTAHQLGYAMVGEMGYGSSWAGFSHAAQTGVGHPAVLQDLNGVTILQSAAAQTLYMRQGNSNRLSIDTASIWYSGLATLRTDNYASQLTGMHLGYDGSIDCRYLFTDQLHAKAFIADLEQALAGGQIISKSVTILDETFTAPFPGGTTTLTVKDLPSATGMQVFQASDFVRLRTFSRAGGSLSITDCWGTVSSPVDNGDKTQSWTFTRSGTATYSTIAFIATNAASNTSSTTVNPNKPTGTLSGHVILAALSFAGTPTITPPSGWTLIASLPGTGITLNIYVKIAGGSEPVSYTWTFNTATNSSCSLATYSNCFTSGNLEIDSLNIQANASSTSMSATGVIPESSAGMLVFMGATPNIRATPPASMTERSDTGVTAAGSYIADQLLSSFSATPTKTATLATAGANVAAQVLLLPAYTALSTEAGAMTPFLGTVDPDAIVLDYGTSGNGYAEVNAIDGTYGANSPYYQIVTWTTHPTNISLRARLGNLSGVTDTSLTPSGYGLYSQNAFLTGDFVTAGGLIRMYAATGINLQESTGGAITSTVDQHALQWWPDVTNRAGSATLSIGTTKPTSGTFSGWNIANVNMIPNNSVVAEIITRVSGQGTGTDAVLTMLGGSQSLAAASNILASADTLSLSGTTTITGATTVSISSTSATGIIASMPASTSASAIIAKYNGTNRVLINALSNENSFNLSSFDNGSSLGPYVNIGRNSNATTSAAGLIILTTKGGTAEYLYCDNSGNLRIGTTLPTSANDTSNTVVGTQTSSLSAKDIIGGVISPRDALSNILTATKALRRFTYKNGSFDNQVFDGVVIDYAPRYGMDNGKSLNDITLFNDLILSIQALSDRLEKLENN